MTIFFKKEEWSMRNYSTWFQNLLYCYSNQDSVVLMDELTHRSIVQNQELRNRLTKHMLNWSTTQTEMETKQHATKKKPNGSVMKSERKFKNTLRQMTMKTKPYKIYEMEKSSPKREVHSNTDFTQKNKKKTQINNLTYHLMYL